MPTTRQPIQRTRNPGISPEALKLFAELEAVPASRRNSDYYKGCRRELMRMLGLTNQWWTGCSVLDRSKRPVHASPEYLEHHHWHECRQVRQQLLQALKDREGEHVG
jgi:hypothetical protein